jgi:hypothetical protein
MIPPERFDYCSCSKSESVNLSKTGTKNGFRVQCVQGFRLVAREESETIALALFFSLYPKLPRRQRAPPQEPLGREQADTNHSVKAESVTGFLARSRPSRYGTLTQQTDIDLIRPPRGFHGYDDIAHDERLREEGVDGVFLKFLEPCRSHASRHHDDSPGVTFFPNRLDEFQSCHFGHLIIGQDGIELTVIIVEEQKAIDAINSRDYFNVILDESESQREPHE